MIYMLAKYLFLLLFINEICFSRQFQVHYLDFGFQTLPINEWKPNHQVSAMWYRWSTEFNLNSHQCRLFHTIPSSRGELLTFTSSHCLDVKRNQATYTVYIYPTKYTTRYMAWLFVGGSIREYIAIPISTQCNDFIWMQYFFHICAACIQLIVLRWSNKNNGSKETRKIWKISYDATTEILVKWSIATIAKVCSSTAILVPMKHKLLYIIINQLASSLWLTRKLGSEWIL